MFAIAVAAASLIAVTACSRSTDKPEAGAAPAVPAPTGPSTTTVPKSLVDAGEYGENIYDAAKASSWSAAGDKLRSLKDAAQRLRADVTNATSGEGRLDSEIGALDKAVADKNRLATMRAANQVTSIAANMSEPFKRKVPADVVRLDYYGRELEIGAAAQDLPKLKTTAAEMRSVWEHMDSVLSPRIHIICQLKPGRGWHALKLAT